ncbi:MAG: hypothetical protein UT36_C0013G0022 [Candidatus Peregrinibacteria bacterium GW2011_GWF2_39_17]|nr:MAG: hypothetical protein UT36_C0013G0022 [Candidatus Peregrinibacteria bacterium GW2011_GWF2_39_17]
MIFLLIPAIYIQLEKRNIYSDITLIPEYHVGIVFGAGVKGNNTPTDILKDRLITAAELYQNGTIQKILVSGDNRVENYNEPQVMKNYLVNTYQIPEKNIVTDFAGRRTYDTCARAHKIWDIKKAILITQGYHLPRALFTCNSLGIDSTGYSSTRQLYRNEIKFKLREIAAIYVSIWDIYIWHPSYIGGEKENI